MNRILNDFQSFKLNFLSSSTPSTTPLTSHSIHVNRLIVDGLVNSVSDNSYRNINKVEVINNFNLSTLLNITLNNSENGSFDGGIDGFGSTTSGTGYDDTQLQEIPSYIRITSMILCILIMCLGVIGNVMVKYFVYIES